MTVACHACEREHNVDVVLDPDCNFVTDYGQYSYKDEPEQHNYPDNLSRYSEPIPHAMSPTNSCLCDYPSPSALPLAYLQGLPGSEKRARLSCWLREPL